MVRIRASIVAALTVLGLTSAKDAPAAPAAPAAAPAPASADADKLRRGVVQVEQGGRPIAVGTVLANDGRVITALSALGAIDNPEIRFADNTVVKAKVGHKDKSWDLALLVPQSGKWPDGLRATDADPAGLELKAFLPKAGKLAPSAVQLKGRMDAHTRDGGPARDLLDVDFKGTQSVPGAPILDPEGRVVGVIVRLCKDAPAETKADAGSAAPCSLMTIGAPVTALRGFLMKTPATATTPAPWLGLGGAPTEAGAVKGIRVMGVAPGSPAEKAGLKGGGENPDTLVAVDGQPLETPEQLAELISKRAIGQNVKFLVYGQTKYREVVVTLRAAP